MTPTLLQALEAATANKVALGHFNVSELVALKAAAHVALERRVPVIIGLSEGEREFFGTREVAALVRSLREDSGVVLYLNADHTHSIDKVEEAARAGFDSVVFDASKLAFDVNVAQTKRAVEAAKAINPSILVEGEIGYLGSGSEVHDVSGAGLALTTHEEARQFVNETRVDVLAPAVGSKHGMSPSMVAGESHKRLDVGRIAAIKAATGLFLTLHGGSGTGDDDFRAAVRAGITVIHISTELRVAWRRGLESDLKLHSDEIAPYELFSEAFTRVADVMRHKLQVFQAGPFDLSFGLQDHLPDGRRCDAFEHLVREACLRQRQRWPELQREPASGGQGADLDECLPRHSHEDEHAAHAQLRCERGVGVRHRGHQDASGNETPEQLLLGGAPDRVDDGVDWRNVSGKLLGSAVHDLLHPERAHVIHCGRRAGSDDRRTASHRELDGERADAAPGAVHEDALSCDHGCASSSTISASCRCRDDGKASHRLARGSSPSGLGATMAADATAKSA